MLRLILIFILLFNSQVSAEQTPFEESGVKKASIKKAVKLNGEAVSYVFHGDKEKAFEKLNEALNCNPGNTSVLYNLAGLHLANGSLHSAKVEIEKALIISPNEISFLTRYGEVLMLSKEFQLAEKTFLKMLELEPQLIIAKQKLAIVYGMLQKWELAENTFREVRKVKGDDKNLLSNLGSILLVREKFNEAITVLERAQTLYADADNEMSLGIAYEAIGLRDRARQSYKRARALGHTDKATLAQLVSY